MTTADRDLDATPDAADRTDFENADRGFVSAPEAGTITGEEGRVLWDFGDTAFLDADCPDTAHPYLWRQSQLCARAGLYEVTEGIYQVRGFDLSNMTLIEGRRGVVVVDLLVSAETAAAALALYRRHRGERPVTAVVFTHSHLDHFGGVRGVLKDTEDIPVVAPQGFLTNSVAENVYAGTAMLRRSVYYAGTHLDRNPAGLIGMGLGFTASHGSRDLVPPTLDITRTGQEATLDGVLFRFQLTPDTEAPSEMNFFLPERRALCMAENATHTLHNVLTLRGARVRDARLWSRYLNEAIELFGHDTDVIFASHHWPTWGREHIHTFLADQRDLYAYLHDQTLRLANEGHTGTEIAEMIQLPPALSRTWHARGHYGSVSHNVKAIYQRYMGWYDGHPSSLWEHPPTESGTRYVECMGGVDEVVTKARSYADDGDLRFAAQLLRHAVFAAPDHADAKEELARVFERLAYGAECATWRNCYLMGARELRHGVRPTPVSPSSLVPALSVEQLFDSLAVRVNGPRAWDHSLQIRWHFTDLRESYRMTLHNGVLVHVTTPPTADGAQLVLTLTKPQLLKLLAGQLDVEAVRHSGDPEVLNTLLSVLDEPDPDFAIVTP